MPEPIQRTPSLRDLQRGWRVTLPNLEQSGPIVIDYPAPLLVLICSEFIAGALVTYFSTVESAVIGGHVPAGERVPG